MRLGLRGTAFAVSALTALVCAPGAGAENGKVTAATIDMVMVTQDEGARVMGVPLTEIARSNSLFASATDRPDCGSVVIPSMSSYDNSGYTAGHAQMLYDDHPGWWNRIDQAVSIFETNSDAADFVRSEADRWRRCENQTARSNYDSGSDNPALEGRYQLRKIIQVEEVVAVGYGMTVNGVYASCQHVLVGVLNTAVDVRTCSSVNKQQGEHAFDLVLMLQPKLQAAAG